MTYEELQVENGNFTRIINPLIDELLKLPFKGCELAIAFYIIRKTYGYNKKQDEIPLSQFQKDLCRSRQTIVTALKNLQLVGVARLVQRGSMKGDGNIWAINKYTEQWKLVNMARLVQRKRGASLTVTKNLVKTARQSSDYTHKTISKDSDLPEWLNKEIWNNWIAYRKDKKQTLTPRSIELQLKELSKDISNHVAIIEQSIKNGWTGIFPLKGQKNTPLKNSVISSKYSKYENTQQN